MLRFTLSHLFFFSQLLYATVCPWPELKLQASCVWIWLDSVAFLFTGLNYKRFRILTLFYIWNWDLQRFFPSEFGLDVDRAHTVEPATSNCAAKVQIRRAIEAEGIPYTIVCSNYFAGYSLPTLAQADSFGPPTDTVVIYGDGNTKGAFIYIVIRWDNWF